MPITDPPKFPLQNATQRKQNIVNNYVVPMLGVLTKLQVWDELAKVVNSSQGIIQVTYQNLLTDFNEEIFQNDNEKVDSSLFTVDKPNGIITFQEPQSSEPSSSSPPVLTVDMEGADFFVTYRFNYFADMDLSSFVDLGLVLVNASSEPNTHLNNYTLESAPPYWDAPIALYTYMRALETMLTDTLIWKNYLIFQDGAAAQGLLEAEIARTGQLFHDLRVSVKRVHLVKQAGYLYDVFASSGIGSFTRFSRRLRGFRSNRIGIPQGL